MLEKSSEFIDTNYKRYLNKYQEKKEKEEAKKRKKEQEELDKEKALQNNKTATVREITEEEYQRKKNEERLKQQQDIQMEENVETPNIKIDDIKKTEKEKEEDKVEAGKIRPSFGNGSCTENYSWTQHDIKEISATIPIPKNIKGKDLLVKYDNKELLIQIKGQPQPIIKGEFYASIKTDSVVWTIDEIKNGKAIIFTFEKFDSMKWWDSFIKGEQPIDTAKISPEPSKISDIEDVEMRAQVEKMMFDTRQKAQGLPTSDQLGKHKMMEQFMKAHPEMDFSKCKFDN